MTKALNEAVVLANGVRMPWLGLGVWRVSEGGEVVSSVKSALASGYRSIDTAAVYGNETGVGQAVKESGVPRSELFITTKVWNEAQGYDSTLAAFEQSRKKLGLEYLDLYLIHWPVAKSGKFKDTWKALEKLYKAGHIRSIGVSNFQMHHLEELMADAEVTPMVNQVECHPLLTQKPLLAFCQKHSIQLEAWSPLMQGHLDLPLLTELAAKYDKTPAQVILRWDLQNGVVIIPKSVREARIRENADIFDFELSADDIQRIDALNENKRFGPDPDKFG